MQDIDLRDYLCFFGVALCDNYAIEQGVYPNEIHVPIKLRILFTSIPASTYWLPSAFGLDMPLVFMEVGTTAPAYNESRDNRLKGSVYV